MRFTMRSKCKVVLISAFGFWKKSPLNISPTNDESGEAIHPSPYSLSMSTPLLMLEVPKAIYSHFPTIFPHLFINFHTCGYLGIILSVKTSMLNFNAKDLWARFGHCLQIKLLICSLGLYYWHDTVYVSLI